MESGPETCEEPEAEAEATGYGYTNQATDQLNGYGIDGYGHSKEAGDNGAQRAAQAQVHVSLDENDQDEQASTKCRQMWPSMLELSGNRVEDDGAIRLAVVLESIAWLEVLDLSNAFIGADGACSIAHALRTNPRWCIRVLNMSGNLIEDRGAAALCQALTVRAEANVSPVLTELRLINCGITSLPVDFMLHGCQQLRVLELQENPLKDPPRSAAKDSESLLKYFEALRHGSEPLKTARLMLVGYGGQGKTTFGKAVQAWEKKESFVVCEDTPQKWTADDVRAWAQERTLGTEVEQALIGLSGVQLLQLAAGGQIRGLQKQQWQRLHCELQLLQEKHGYQSTVGAHQSTCGVWEVRVMSLCEPFVRANLCLWCG